MVQIRSMQVILPTRDINGAAKLYSEILDFKILDEGASHITLGQGDLRLSLIKAEPGLTPCGHPVQLRFTVSEPQHLSDIAERVKRLNLPVLEEMYQQPDGAQSFTCLGPDEHMIEIRYEPVQPASIEQLPEAKLVQPTEPVTEPKPSQPIAEPPAAQTQPSAPSAEPPAPQSQSRAPSPTTPPGRPTRADRYMLEAQERLAKIKEELASISTSFSQTDIAGTLDEMAGKVVRRVSEVAGKVVTPSDEEAERERKRQEAEDALARYKQVVAQEYSTPAKPDKPEEENLKPVRKTLGPASDDKPPSE